MAKTKNKMAETRPRHAFTLLTVIIKSGYGDEITNLLTDQQVRLIFNCTGEGTASSSLRHLLSLDDGKKDVVMAVVAEAKVDELIALITTHFPHSGIVFTIKFSRLGGRNLLNYLTGGTENE